MMEKYPYPSAAHHAAKIIAKESFPLTKEYLTRAYGTALIQVGKDRTMTFGEALDKIGLDTYENAVSFFSAWNAKL